jgi:hypothetical protein
MVGRGSGDTLPTTVNGKRIAINVQVSRCLYQLGADMSMTLVEALGQVDLEEGRVYRCHVKGHWVELRVLTPDEVRPVARFDESDVMLDAWVELPRPRSKFTVRARRGTLPLPDVPEIPADEDHA